MTSFANVPDLVLAVALYGLTGLALLLLAFVARVAINRWRANTAANNRQQATGRYAEIQASIRRAEDAARLQ